MRSRGRLALALAILGVAGGPAGAQCPDGSAPPCKGAAVGTRRASPPLDDRTWIVVPFDNLRNAQDIEWLRDASVNLLYLDMSRWRDIRVIDDERVADLLREVPAAQGPKIDLNAGLAVARRAGAGRLVMGDLLQLGTRTSVTAKVFDVRTGQRVRSVQEATAAPDSVMPMFGKLAQRILNVAPPAGTAVSAAGTARIDAYQEYLSGVAALNRFDVAEARQRLARALELDSTFALAHYKMSLALGWGDVQTQNLRVHAEAAERLGATLPARERSLIKGQVLRARSDDTGACGVYNDLVRADSSDVEAWYGLGECSFHDLGLEIVTPDSSRLRFHGSLNTAIRAFEKVLALDPGYHIAFQHIVDVLQMGRRTTCLRAPGTTRCAVNVEAYLILSGDTLVVEPLRSIRDSAAVRAQRDERLRSGSRRRQLLRADSVTQRWVFAGPSETRAKAIRAGVLQALGRVREAQAELSQVRARSADEGLQVALTRMEVAAKLGEGLEANRLYDSVRAAPEASTPPAPVAGLPPGTLRPTLRDIAGSYGSALGRLADADSFFVRAMSPSAPPIALPFMRGNIRVMIGASPDSLDAIETAVYAEFARQGVQVPVSQRVLPSTLYSIALPRSRWPDVDTSTGDLKQQMVLAVSRKDTARLRRVAARMDSLARVLGNALVSDTGLATAAADAYRFLGDSAAALRSLRFMLDSTVMHVSLNTPVSGGSYWQLIPRATLARADLAASLGHRDEAKTWYKRFLDLWVKADRELQPIVERARRAYAALGGSA